MAVYATSRKDVLFLLAIADLVKVEELLQGGHTDAALKIVSAAVADLRKEGLYK
jgi:hypothetical protein